MPRGQMGRQRKVKTPVTPGRGTMRAIEPNPVGSVIAKGLFGARDYMDGAQIPNAVPLFGGMGIGQLLMGESPEVIDEMASGFMPYKGSGHTTQLDPRVLDVAGLPLPYAGVGALGKTAFNVAKRKSLGAIAETAVDAGRRGFMKKAAGATALVAGASSVPGVLKGLATAGKATAKPIAADVARTVGVGASRQAVRQLSAMWAPGLLSALRNMPGLYAVLKAKGYKALGDTGYSKNQKELDEVLSAFEKNQGKDIIGDFDNHVYDDNGFVKKYAPNTEDFNTEQVDNYIYNARKYAEEKGYPFNLEDEITGYMNESYSWAQDPIPILHGIDLKKLPVDEAKIIKRMQKENPTFMDFLDNQFSKDKYDGVYDSLLNPEYEIK